ncbi:MAG: cation transporter [Clostridiales bacterium]|nr:cation transporter [Clostridiales bacterium]
MIKLLSKLLIKNNNDYSDPTVRRRYGILCGSVGVALNLLLSLGKFIAGLSVNSIAVIADAANNLSDAGSSVITMAGFKLAGQKPDPAHPFGHGRIEYISGLIVSMAILLMGFELLKTSVEKIFSPEETVFSIAAIVILCASIAVKLYIFFYNKKIAAKINSSAMAATATDSVSDCLATAATLLSIILSAATGINLDGYCGVIVALFILFAGFKAAKDTVNPLLGQKPDPEFVKQIEETVLSHEEVVGIHDLVVHDYGPGRIMISLHAEVSDKENILKIHDVIDNIEKELQKKLECHAVIHMDPISTDDENTLKLKKEINEIVKKENPEFSIHDFRVVAGDTHTNIIFDLLIPYGISEDEENIKKKIDDEVKKLNKNYFTVIEIDKNFV